MIHASRRKTPVGEGKGEQKCPRCGTVEAKGTYCSLCLFKFVKEKP